MLALWLEAKSGKQTQKCRKRQGREKKKEKHRGKKKMYENPTVNETAYLSALSVMCKHRPFRAARHTIALFAMQ